MRVSLSFAQNSGKRKVKVKRKLSLRFEIKFHVSASIRSCPSPVFPPPNIQILRVHNLFTNKKEEGRRWGEGGCRIKRIQSAS